VASYPFLLGLPNIVREAATGTQLLGAADSEALLAGCGHIFAGRIVLFRKIKELLE
jgi:hypothetical protein